MDVFQFDNGIEVPRDFLSQEQLDRYETNKGGKLHEPIEEALFKKAIMRLPDSAYYVNIGAAWGYYAILAKLLRPGIEVCAVEAHPRMCRRMFQALELNQISGITVVNKAVVGSSAVSTPMGIGFGYGAKVHPVKPGNEFIVATCDIRSLLRSLSQTSELMVTMDIQGAEVDVLTDVKVGKNIRSRISEILVGTHGAHRHEACLSILREANFRVVADDPSPEEQPDGIIYAQSH